MDKKITENTNNSNNNLNNFLTSLPIYPFKSEIISLIKNNNFLIITGETGSGKTTQLPQYLLDNLYLSNFYKDLPPNYIYQRPNIVITQPRRISAIQMAKRICYERNCTLGNEIGYSIRFEEKSSANTKIKFVTDGILVKECLTDIELSKYQICIIDEAHERSLYSDILFGLMKSLIKKRGNSFKLIIMSATLNIEKFKAYFNNCPNLHIQGKIYPVEISYHPSLMEKRVINSVQLSLRIHLHEPEGHILCFLTGFEECESACKLAFEKLNELSKKNKYVPPLIILPLYGAQNTDEQSKVFEEYNCRKLIFCTNIAETSLTVNGIGYVIDCGYVKQKMYNSKTSMDSLILVPISRVQAKQRSGRAGRTRPGKCLRLYTENFYNTSMNENIIPEILRVNLNSTILTLKSMGINNIINFDFIDKPNKDSVQEGIKNLAYLQAIDSEGKITLLGKEMIKFPIDCCYSRALIASNFFNVLDEMEIIVSLVSSENLFINITKYDEEKRRIFEENRNNFMDKFSDHITLLNTYKEIEFNNFDENFCKKNYIRFKTLKLCKNIKTQLDEYMHTIRLKECEKYFNIKSINKLRSKIENLKNLDDYLKINYLIRMSLCQGFFMNTCRIMNNSNDNLNFIRLNDGISISLDNYSCIKVKKIEPEFVIFTELSGSLNKPIMKQVSVIEYEWISDLIEYIKKINIKKLTYDKNNKNEEEIIKIEKDEKENTLLTLYKNCISNEKTEEKKEDLNKKLDEYKLKYLQRKRKLN